MAVIAKISRVLTCPACQKHMRWSSGESARVRCPGCGTRFVALACSSGGCEAVVEDDDSVSQMIADWLKPDWDDEDDFSSELESMGSALGANAIAVDVDQMVRAILTLNPQPNSAVDPPAGARSPNSPARKAG